MFAYVLYAFKMAASQKWWIFSRADIRLLQMSALMSMLLLKDARDLHINTAVSMVMEKRLMSSFNMRPC